MELENRELLADWRCSEGSTSSSSLLLRASETPSARAIAASACRCAICCCSRFCSFALHNASDNAVHASLQLLALTASIRLLGVLHAQFRRIEHSHFIGHYLPPVGAALFVYRDAITFDYLQHDSRKSRTEVRPAINARLWVKQKTNSNF